MYLTKKNQLTFLLILFVLAHNIPPKSPPPHSLMPSAKAFSDCSCRRNLLICFTGECSGLTDLPPPLESCSAATCYQNAECVERAVSGFFWFFPTQIPHRNLINKMALSLRSNLSVMVISIVLKGRLVALEVAKPRIGVLRNIRGWHF